MTISCFTLCCYSVFSNFVQFIYTSLAILKGNFQKSQYSFIYHNVIFLYSFYIIVLIFYVFLLKDISIKILEITFATRP